MSDSSPSPIQEPSAWDIHHESILLEVELFEKAQKKISENDSSEQAMTNNERRKMCYRLFSIAINGSMGKGNRKPLPSCVVANVRKAFPNEDGSSRFMGFKDS